MPPSFETQHPVFVLGLFDTGLVTAQGLARHGISVVGFDCDKRSPGFFSKLFSPVLCPSPHGGDDPALLALLKSQAKAFTKPPVLYPTSDAFVGFIARNTQELAKSFLFNIPEPSVAEKILAKHTQAELAQKAGAMVPKMLLFTPETVDSLLSSCKNSTEINKFHFPAFFKPVHGYQWQRHIKNKGMLVRSPGELRIALQNIRKFDLKAILQEIVVGPASEQFEISLYVDTKGDISGPFVMRKWRSFPRELGTGTYGTSLIDPTLSTIAQSLALKMGIRGFANMEFKLDACDSTFKFIEVNPRVWQQVGLATDCGLDLLLTQYLDLTKQQFSPVTQYQAGVHWIDPITDLLANPSFYDWIRVFHSATSRGILAIDDPWPAVRTIFLSRRFFGLLKALLKKTWLMLATR
jgi:predicted ATP-grasp superfamily ATP-dependent carboligase